MTLLLAAHDLEDANVGDPSLLGDLAEAAPEPVRLADRLVPRLVSLAAPERRLPDDGELAQVSSFGPLKNGKAYEPAMAIRLDKNLSDYSPPAFRDVLLDMARSASRQVVAVT